MSKTLSTATGFINNKSSGNIMNVPEAMLLLDERYLESRQNVQRRFFQPQLHQSNPILHTGQEPWDTLPLLFGSVLFDPLVGKYRMWYCSCGPVPPEENAIYLNSSVALAESEDGFQWNRAKLKKGLIEDGFPEYDTNIVFKPNDSEILISHGSVLLDENAEPSKRYLMIYAALNRKNCKDRYYRLAWSPDGINWSRGNKITYQPPGVIDYHDLIRNPKTQQYHLYFRGDKPLRTEFSTTEKTERVVCLQSSYDLETWTPTKVIMKNDEKDEPHTDIYSLQPFWRDRSMVGVYQSHNQHCDHQIVTTHLCWSHDGHEWQRHQQEEFIPLDEPGEWARFNNAVANQPLIIEDNMLFYYSGRCNRHGGYNPSNSFDSGQPWTGIGIATMKLDRFACLEASFDGGEIVTIPMNWSPGKKLAVNAESRWGKIDIALISDSSQETITLQGLEGTKVPVEFKHPQQGKFQLRIRLENAKIYALYWE